MKALATSTKNTLPKLEPGAAFRYFMMLPKVSWPLQCSSLQDHQAFFQEDDVGRFFGDGLCRCPRDADIGISAWGVVDAVAEEANVCPLPAGLEHSAATA